MCIGVYKGGIFKESSANSANICIAAASEDDINLHPFLLFLCRLRRVQKQTTTSLETTF
jgi:hypothetical protein